MKPTIRMIGLDLDGTVFNSKKQVTPAVEAAIRDACAAGIVVLPATGRQLTGVPAEFLGIEGVRYALTSNGARISDIQTGEILYADSFTPERGLELARFCQQFDMMTSVFIDGGCYADESFYEYLDTVSPNLKDYIRASRQVVPDIADKIREEAKPVEKLSMIFGDEAERARAWAAFEALGDVTVTSSMPNNMEVNTRTANKGAGLLALGRVLGIPREEIMACGDASNDIEMLKAVGFGVAMGNAEPAVKEIANAVTRTNDEDGVAHAIRAVLPE